MNYSKIRIISKVYIFRVLRKIMRLAHFYSIFLETMNNETLLEKCEQLSNEEIESFQLGQIKVLLQSARNNCSYYDDLFEKHQIDITNPADFINIPFLDKKIIRENKDTIKTKNNFDFMYYKMNTGGSTGEPLEFLVSNQIDKVSIHQNYLWNKMEFIPGEKILSFDGAFIPAKLTKQNIYWKQTSRHELPFGKNSFSSLHFNKNTYDFYILAFLKYQPSFLHGYPSFISDFAKLIQDKGVNLIFRIKGVMLTAETASIEQIELIEATFSCKVMKQYGNSEASIFGFSPSTDKEYLISPLYGLTEIIKDNGEHADIGEEGEIVTTSFYNYHHPFIRYKTGDKAIYGGKHKNFIKLNELRGREQDIVYSANGIGLPLVGLIFGQHFKAFKNIVKWQIIQKEKGKIEIVIEKSESYSQNDENEIIDKIKSNIELEIAFNYKIESMVTTKRGKRPFFMQLINTK